MTTPEDDKLIERLARAACEADRHDPDGICVNELWRGGGWVGHSLWEAYCSDARRHLAMQREYQRSRGDMGNPITEQNQCHHEWKEVPVYSFTMPGEHGKMIWTCVRCGERLNKDTDQ